MIKLATSAVLLMSLTLTAWAQRQVPTWLIGTWQGVGYQTDTDTTWAIRFKASRTGYAIEYPSLECGGEWRLLSRDARQARFTETLTYGQSKCLNNGVVVLERLRSGQVVFLYYPQGSAEVQASAILRKRR